MQSTNYNVTLHIGGTLTGTAARAFQLPFAAQLTAVQVSAAANTDSKLNLGTAADEDAYVDDVSLPASGATLVLRRGDFVGGQNIHLPAGSVVVAKVTKGGTAAADVTVFLNFTEG